MFFKMECENIEGLIDISTVEPDIICRLCLQHRVVYFSLFDNNAAEMLESLTSIKVKANDVNINVCSKCLVDLKQAYKLQQRLIQNEMLLQRRLGIVPKLPKSSTNRHKFKSKDSADKVAQSQLKSTVILEGLLTNVTNGDTVIENISTNQKNMYKNLTNSNTVQTQVKNDLSLNEIKNEVNLNEIKNEVSLNEIKNQVSGNEIKNQVSGNVIDQVNIDPLAIEHISELDQFTARYECFTCNLKFQLDSEYIQHITTFHNTAKCGICRKDVEVEDLDDHRRKHQNQAVDCEYCGEKSFKNKATLRSHIKRFHVTPSVLCDLCGVMSAHMIGHENHMIKVHSSSPRSMCCICGKTFTNVSSMKNHMRTVHSDRKTFVCDVCNKEFASRSNLSQHKLMHTDERNNICGFCGKSFKFKANMKTHMKQLHNWTENRTRCETCRLDFADPYALFYHQKMHHK